MTLKNRPKIERCKFSKWGVRIACVDSNVAGEWYVGNTVTYEEAKRLKEDLDSALAAIEADVRAAKAAEKCCSNCGAEQSK